MAFIRHKKIYNNTYAYEVWKVKDENGIWRQRSKYLGVVTDFDTGAYEKKRAKREKQELTVLDYGDSYFINSVVSSLPLFAVLKTVFGSLFETLMVLAFHRICGGQAMRHAQDWYEGNFINQLFPNADVTSQNISRVLSYLGEESVQRAFFGTYIPLVAPCECGVVIDSTGLPNEINMPITDWGYHSGGVEFETRLILAVNRENEMPLYFRYVAGNIGDVTTLANTIKEMKQNGIETSSALVDAGYYSQSNLKMLFAANITFLIRMPSNRVVYKEIIAQNADIESPVYAVKHDKRGLFVKEVAIRLYDNDAFAYLVLDPERRGKEISKLVSQATENGSELEKLDFCNCGKMVLLSSEKLNREDVVPLYHTRQIAERMFGIAKDDLNILPLRTHSEPNFKGFMLLIFISLIMTCAIKSRLGKKISIEQAVSALKNLKCKVYDDEVIPNEVTKKQRVIFETADVVVPKVCGV